MASGDIWGEAELTEEAMEFPFVRQACDFCPAAGLPESNDPMGEDIDSLRSCWTRNTGIFDWYSSATAMECGRCSNECDKMAYMNENGYFSATRFNQCQQIDDSANDEHAALFAGPICNGDRIKIGVFQDQDCQILDVSKEVDDYLVDNEGFQMKLSYVILKSASYDLMDKSLSCVVDAPTSTNATPATYEINEMCQSLKRASFSCQDGNFGVNIDQWKRLWQGTPNVDMMKTFCPGNEPKESASNDTTAAEGSRLGEGRADATSAMDASSTVNLQWGISLTLTTSCFIFMI